MQQKPKRSKVRVLAIGALVGTVLSVGVAASDVSARSIQKTDSTVVDVVLDQPTYPLSMRSGIRW